MMILETAKIQVCSILEYQHHAHEFKITLVHKLTSILTFESLSTTFETSPNVFFTYFCHKIIYYSDNTCIKVASRMLSSIN